MNNVEAMLKMYQGANPTLTRGECIELMKEKESRFLGLDRSDEEVKAITRKANISKGTHFKKRKRRG